MEFYRDMSEPMFRYKNFSMVHELDIAGKFLYSAIEELNKMDSFYHISEDFYFLYNVSVGIERMQKILLVLLYDINNSDIEEFMKSIKNHDHVKLHEKICSKRKINFSKEQNSFLRLISTFYNKGRYERFNYNNEIDFDKKLLTSFILDNCPDIGSDKFLWKYNLVNTEEILEFFGRTIGRIGDKYFESIEEEANKRNLYTYELREESPAQKLFLQQDKKGSYQKKLINEKRAIKELLLYLINPIESNEFIEFMQGIEPLPIEAALVQKYLSDLCTKVVSYELLDEIEFLYKNTVENVSEREREISQLGDKYVMFDYHKK